MSAFNVFRKPLTVKRPGVGTRVDGRWVEATPTVLTVQGSVQPATTEDLQSLPEGRRALGAYKIYSDTKFQSLQENKNNPDVIVIDENDYEVAVVNPWQNGVLPHYMALAVRVQPT